MITAITTTQKKSELKQADLVVNKFSEINSSAIKNLQIKNANYSK